MSTNFKRVIASECDKKFHANKFAIFLTTLLTNIGTNEANDFYCGSKQGNIIDLQKLSFIVTGKTCLLDHMYILHK